MLGKKEIGEKEHIVDGWFDAGVDNQNHSLEELRRQPVNLSSREVILVDCRNDSALARVLKVAQLMSAKFPTLDSKVRVIALQVSSNIPRTLVLTICADSQRHNDSNFSNQPRPIINRTYK